MNIQNLLDSGANVSITLQLEDLRQVVKETVGNLKIPTKESPPEEFISRKEALEVLKIDPSTIWAWQRTGFLKAYPFGGRIRYKLSDIEAIRTGKKGTAASQKSSRSNHYRKGTTL